MIVRMMIMTMMMVMIMMIIRMMITIMMMVMVIMVIMMLMVVMIEISDYTNNGTNDVDSASCDVSVKTLLAHSWTYGNLGCKQAQRSRKPKGPTVQGSVDADDQGFK